MNLEDWLAAGTPIQPVVCDCGSVVLRAVNDYCRECGCWVCGHAHVHGDDEPGCPDAGPVVIGGMTAGRMRPQRNRRRSE